MKHDGHWDQRQQERIAEEYGESAREVVRVMHHDLRVPLRHVAGALYVSETTMRKWCHEWNLETHHSGYAKLRVPGKVELRARLLGYESAGQAIADWRASGLRWEDIQLKLKCSSSTVSRLIPDAAKGRHNLSAEGRRIKQETMRRLNALRQNKSMPPLGYVHPYWERAT